MPSQQAIDCRCCLKEIITHRDYGTEGGGGHADNALKAGQSKLVRATTLLVMDQVSVYLLFPFTIRCLFYLIMLYSVD